MAKKKESPQGTEWNYSPSPESTTHVKLEKRYALFINNEWVEQPMEHDGAYGAMGGLITTLEDFSRYVAFHQSAWPERDEAELGPLKRSSIREMQFPWNMNSFNPKYTYPNGRKAPAYTAYGYGLSYLKDDQGLLAVFSLLDTPRPGAMEFIKQVQARGIQVHLLSGDDQQTVAWWARYFGIDHLQGGALPEDKFSFSDALQKEGKVVWAVGDGVNDAPFLAKANVSIAVGSGAPLAQAGADAVLTTESLKPLSQALELADKSKIIMRQNLVWAFVYNVIAIPVAMMGLVNPWVAGIGMSLSSLAVTLNAWRLRKISE
mgnify:CR=1 FL=1